jgi:pantoate kinase
MKAHAKDLGEDLEIEDALALYQLQQNPDPSAFLQQTPEFAELVELWQTQAVNEYKNAMSLSGDEALHMKDKMMISYEAWDMMRKMSQTNEVWPGAHQLKALAKEYNSFLAERLGMVSEKKIKKYLRRKSPVDQKV